MGIDEVLAMIDHHIERYDRSIARSQEILRTEMSATLIKAQVDIISWSSTRRAALLLLKIDLDVAMARVRAEE